MCHYSSFKIRKRLCSTFTCHQIQFVKELIMRASSNAITTGMLPPAEQVLVKTSENFPGAPQLYV